VSEAAAAVLDRPDAPPARPAAQHMSLGRAALWLLLPFVVIFGGRFLVAEPFKIPTTSMVPTLEAGDHVLANKLAYRFGSPEVGDVAVLKSPENGEVLVKRIVASAGQRVEIRDGVLFVDRRAQREPYVDYEMVDGFFFGPERVPAGTVFVMGDSRGDSEDSREFGPVPADDLIGSVDLRILPLSRFGGL